MTCPTAVTTTPRIVMTLGSSAEVKTIVPVVASAVEALSSASCVPVSVSEAPVAIDAAPAPVMAAALPAAPAAAALLAAVPAPASAATAYSGRTELDRLRSLDCLAQAIYYEAGRESEDGQRAVAQVVLNRVRHPAFPASVCGVVYQGSTRTTGCQFTFTCDGSLARAPERSSWNRAREVAKAALAGFVQPAVGNATHYHASYVAPYWAPTLAKSAAIGAHIFYRWSGGWGRPPAFAQGYAARESDPRALRLAALSVPHQIVAPALAGSELAKADGVQIRQADRKRVRVLFTPEARDAAAKVQVTPYVERVAASDNLRWTLGGSPAAAEDKPFGQAAAPVEATVAPNVPAGAQ